MDEYGTFYNLHKALSEAKNVITESSMMNTITSFLTNRGYDIIDSSIDSVTVANKSDNKNIYDAMESCMTNIVADNVYNIDRKLRDLGFPEGYTNGVLLNNTNHMYFIIPISPVGMYTIRI